MRKYLYSFLAFGVPFLAAAQEPIVTLTDEEGNVVNETIVHADATILASRDTVSLLAQLNANEERTVNIRRYELDVVSQTRNFFCWGVCYTAQSAGNIPVWESAHPVFIGAGQTVDNFHAYYEAQGHVGSSTFRFVWFDADNTNDSTWVDIVFDATAVGIEENLANAHLTIFPNPSKGADVQFDVEMPSLSGATALVIHNAVGQRIRTTPVRSGQPIARLSTEGLAPGLYFATLDHQGRGLVTQRFVVSGR
ncbi:MAG: T9SS type A sorting domain-containing protein [Flavobacteriales bacterium]|nr:T9SS type A sorting domain-containing protein [Flavobacteriales bacterium]